jgi:Monooxygenase af470-like
MEAKTVRNSVDLSPWPDLVVIYLGFRVTRLRGFLTLFGLGRGINGVARNKPDGLLAHEPVFFGLTHIGMRQYWRDLESLERFTRSEPHRTWWRNFLRDNGGAGFWHEAYCVREGMEAIYLDMPTPVGFGLFAPARHPQGPFMTARGRLAL